MKNFKFTLILMLLFINSLYAAPMNIKVGVYFLDIAQLDLRDNSFFGDFYIWYICSGDKIEEWKPQNIEFMNGQIQERNFLDEKTLPDSSKLFVERVKGIFRARFNFQKYPFDKQKLEIYFEDNNHLISDLRFSLDSEAMVEKKPLFDSFLSLPGWHFSDSIITSETHYYATNFGESKITSKGETYSRVKVSMTITRLFSSHLIKFVIPLVVIAGMAYLVFFINAKEFEAQCGICVTALLSAVALHISQADALPAVGYLVVADRIFIFFYLIIFMALIQTVVVNNYAKKGDTESAERLDKLFRYTYPIATIAGSLLIGIFQ